LFNHDKLKSNAHHVANNDFFLKKSVTKFKYSVIVINNYKYFLFLNTHCFFLIYIHTQKHTEDRFEKKEMK
jgi:hypothetical protein